MSCDESTVFWASNPYGDMSEYAEIETKSIFEEEYFAGSPTTRKDASLPIQISPRRSMHNYPFTNRLDAQDPRMNAREIKKGDPIKIEGVTFDTTNHKHAKPTVTLLHMDGKSSLISQLLKTADATTDQLIKLAARRQAKKRERRLRLANATFNSINFDTAVRSVNKTISPPIDAFISW